jgi:hypothetical protein
MIASSGPGGKFLSNDESGDFEIAISVVSMTYSQVDAF